MLRGLVAYAERHYCIRTLLGRAQLDRRRNPRYSAFGIILVLGLMSFLGLKSALAASRSRKLARCLSGPMPTDAVLSDAPRRFDVDGLARSLASIVRQMVRKKQFGVGFRYNIAALDGTEFARCAVALKSTKLRKTPWAYWTPIAETNLAYLRGVNAVLVNRRYPVKLAVALEGNGRGETTVVREDILPTLKEHYGGMIDAVVADALHGNRPMIQACVDNGFAFLLRIKENWPTMIEEGERLLAFSGRTAYTGSSNRPRDGKSRYRIESTPMSVDLDAGRRVDGRFIKQTKLNGGPNDDYPRYFFSNIPEGVYAENELADLYSERFDCIEIQTHRNDWQHHHLDHLLDHDPIAVLARLYIVAIFANIDIVYRAVTQWTGTWAEWIEHMIDDVTVMTTALFPRDEVVLVGRI